MRRTAISIGCSGGAAFLGLAAVLLPAALLPATPLLATDCAAASAAGGEAVTVVIVRHAEKAGEPADDPPLSEAGKARARELARVMGDGAVTALYASDRRRTLETVRPLADRLGLSARVLPALDAAGLAAELAALPGGVAVVAAHSNTIGPIIEALGGGTIPPIEDRDYDDLFVVTLLAPGRARVVHLSYGAATP